MLSCISPKGLPEIMPLRLSKIQTQMLPMLAKLIREPQNLAVRLLLTISTYRKQAYQGWYIRVFPRCFDKLFIPLTEHLLYSYLGCHTNTKGADLGRYTVVTAVKGMVIRPH